LKCIISISIFEWFHVVDVMYGIKKVKFWKKKKKKKKILKKKKKKKKILSICKYCSLSNSKHCCHRYEKIQNQAMILIVVTKSIILINNINRNNLVNNSSGIDSEK